MIFKPLANQKAGNSFKEQVNIHVSCLLLHNTPKLGGLKQHLSHIFCESGKQIQTNWVVLPQSLSQGYYQDTGQDCSYLKVSVKEDLFPNSPTWQSSGCRTTSRLIHMTDHRRSTSKLTHMCLCTGLPHDVAADFSRASKECTQFNILFFKATVIFVMILKVTSYHFCHISFIRNE